MAWDITVTQCVLAPTDSERAVVHVWFCFQNATFCLAVSFFRRKPELATAKVVLPVARVASRVIKKSLEQVARAYPDVSMIKKLLVPTSGSPDDDSVFARTLNVVRPLDAYFEFYHLQFSASETAVRTLHMDFAVGAAADPSR